MSGLRDEVQHLKAVDQHAHPVLKAESELPFAAAFTEATDPSIWERDTPHGLFYRRSVKQLAKLYRCAARDVDLLTVRKRLDLTARTALCLQESHLKTLLLDDGMMADDSMSLDWHRQFVPVKRLLRIEQLVESLLAAHESFEEFDQAFTERLQNRRLPWWVGCPGRHPFQSCQRVCPGPGESRCVRLSVLFLRFSPRYGDRPRKRSARAVSYRLR